MADLGRARVVGIVGTLLGFIGPYVAAVLSVLVFAAVGSPASYYTLLIGLGSVPAWFLIGYALWIVSKAAGAARIFWFYVVAVVISAIANSVLQPGLTGSLTGLSATSTSDLVGVTLYFGPIIVAGVFSFLSFLTIARRLGFRLFMWAAIIGLVAVVVSAVIDAAVVMAMTVWSLTSLVYPLIDVFFLIPTVISLAGIVIDVAAFNSLHEQPKVTSATVG